MPDIFCCRIGVQLFTKLAVANLLIQWKGFENVHHGTSQLTDSFLGGFKLISCLFGDIKSLDKSSAKLSQSSLVGRILLSRFQLLLWIWSVFLACNKVKASVFTSMHPQHESVMIIHPREINFELHCYMFNSLYGRGLVRLKCRMQLLTESRKK